MVKVDTSALVEENIGCTGDDLILLGALAHFVIVELVPSTPIQREGSIVTRAQLPLVIRNGEQIVQRAIRWALTTHYEFGHVQTVLGEVNQSILLGVTASKALQIDY